MMRRAIAQSALPRANSSICIFCRLNPTIPPRATKSPLRLLSTTLATGRVGGGPSNSSKGKGGRPNIRFSSKDPFGHDEPPPPRFLEGKHFKPPPTVHIPEKSPWSVQTLKARLGHVFKGTESNKDLIWTTEAREKQAKDPKEFKRRYSEYVERIRKAVALKGAANEDTPEEIRSAMKDLDNFRRMYEQGGVAALDVSLMDHFLINYYDENRTVKAQRGLTNFLYPTEWFPRTRTLKRVWHLHVGPTNSGKTYNALKRLEESKDGIYCGPLRLLANEVYERLNAKGIKCNLVTGEERRLHEGEDVKLVSSTVEMAAVESPFEVAVIDEIQMLADPERGWAWTHAVLGVMAKELHLCGEERAVDIVTKIAALCGEEVVIHRYKRLGSLEVQDDSLNGDFSRIEKGDCVVAFSRKDIHILKKFVEKTTGLKCAIVYGALPAETRAMQAKYFNDPDSDYDVLIASDAIGLGLNLSIKRIVFSTMYKYNGKENVMVPIPLTRQIAGRAGRYRSSADDGKKTATAFPPQGTDGNITTLGPPADSKTGYVTTFVARDLPVLRMNMSTEPDAIERAVLLPRNSVIENYCALFPRTTPFHQILERISTQANVGNLFEFSNIEPMIEVAKLIQDVEGLSDMERITLTLAPVKLQSETCVQGFVDTVKIIGAGKPSTILDLPNLDLNVLELKTEKPLEVVRRLEELHTVIMLYSWVSQRFRHILLGEEITLQLKNVVEMELDRLMREERSDVKIGSKFRQRSRPVKLSMVHGSSSAPDRSRAIPPNVDFSRTHRSASHATI